MDSRTVTGSMGVMKVEVLDDPVDGHIYVLVIGVS